MAGHTQHSWTQLTVRTAKCDVCNHHNGAFIYRCVDCSYQICTPCQSPSKSDQKAVLNTVTPPQVEATNNESKGVPCSSQPSAPSRNQKYEISDSTDTADDDVQEVPQPLQIVQRTKESMATRQQHQKTTPGRIPAPKLQQPPEIREKTPPDISRAADTLLALAAAACSSSDSDDSDTDLDSDRGYSDVASHTRTKLTEPIASPPVSQHSSSKMTYDQWRARNGITSERHSTPYHSSRTRTMDLTVASTQGLVKENTRTTKAHSPSMPQWQASYNVDALHHNNSFQAARKVPGSSRRIERLPPPGSDMIDLIGMSPVVRSAETMAHYPGDDHEGVRMDLGERAGMKDPRKCRAWEL